MLTDQALEELRQERHDDYVAEAPPLYPALIHVLLFLEKSRAALVLKKMWLDRRRGPQKDALFEGYYEVAKRAHDQLEHAKNNGLLLLCWHGTRALDGHEGWPA